MEWDEIECKAIYFVKNIEEACAPERMTKQEALEFTGEIISRLETDCEALREELEQEAIED